MLPELTWKAATYTGRKYEFKDSDFLVTVHRLSAKACKERNYPQCKVGWAMQFHRGGNRASAFHETASAAMGNAARIIGYCRGTHDVLGNLKPSA